MMPTSRVELYAAIRRDARAGMSGREIERKHGVGYRTVRDALGSAWPQHRKEYSPRPPKLDPFKAAVDAILLADLKAPRKQRHTVTRIYQRLLDEHAMTGVSYPVLQRYVKERRAQILAESGHGASVRRRTAWPRQQRQLLGMDPNVHRPASVRGDRRSTYVWRQHR